MNTQKVFNYVDISYLSQHLTYTQVHDTRSMEIVYHFCIRNPNVTQEVRNILKETIGIMWSVRLSDS